MGCSWLILIVAKLFYLLVGWFVLVCFGLVFLLNVRMFFFINGDKEVCLV